MNFRDNNYQQNYDDLSKNVIANSAVAKYSQIKAKKKSVPIDKEKLYEDNYDLRGRVKELEEINLKLRTQLAVAEKEKEELFNMAEEQVFHQKIPQRSQSGAHKMSVVNALENKSNLTLLKEKQNQTFKKLVREKHNEIEKLRLENANIKKTMKFTRLSELVAENNQLIDETKRLKMQIIEARSYTDQFNVDYSNRIDSLKRQLQQERDGEKRNGVQLKKQIEIVNELREKLREIELKKVDAEKRLNREIKSLRAENIELRSKLATETTGKECDKAECLKIRKEKMDLKKKIEQLDKQVKSLNDDLLAQKKNALDMEFQYKRLLHSNKKNESHTKGKESNEEVRPAVQHKPSKTEEIPQNSKQTEKSQIKNDSSLHQQSNTKEKSLSESNNPPPKQVQAPPAKIAQPVKVQKAQSKASIEHKNQAIQGPKKQQVIAKQVQKAKKTQENYQSDDTQKLLQSIEGKPEKKHQQPKRQQKASKVEEKVNKQVKLQENKYKESDGQYEQIQFQEQESPKQKQKPKPQKKEKKQKHKAKNEEGKKQKTKQKSTKKLAAKQQSDEQILYQNDKKEENQESKAELKLIRQTLTYKFMAQGYTYEQFANLVKQSGKKDFTVTQIMSVLSEEPFLLSQQNVEAIIIYLYETDNLTGEETISNKNFMKKMKKFIGKAKPINQELESERINNLVQIIQADEGGKKKIRSQCKKADLGDGSISKESFIAIMKEVNVKNELLQTALAQIVYISGDINHLNYDFFLKRLTDVEG